MTPVLRKTFIQEAFPRSAATADVRQALFARGLIEISDNTQSAEDDAQTLRLAIREPQNELNRNRAAIHLAAVESVIGAAAPSSGGKDAARAGKRSGLLSDRDLQIHDVVGGERFRTLKNAEIMKETNLKKRLRLDFGLEPGDAAKRCLDRIREAKGYPLSREIAKKTGNPPERPAVLQQLTTTAQSVREYRPIPASCG